MTQYQMVLDHLKTFGSITPLEALREYGVMRLGAIIYKMRKIYNIETEYETNINRFGAKVRYAKYILEQ